jgi:hypothetical protein
VNKQHIPVWYVSLWLATFVPAPTVSAEPQETLPDFDVLDINEGELRFIDALPTKPPHLQSTHIVFNDESMNTGWSAVKQCHYHIDRVQAMQVVFNRDRVRKLRIVQAENIGRAWVEGPTVQLTNVGSNATLCIVSENRALRRNRLDGSFEWRGGPYMRRFLDGYFPMHVKIAIDYPSQQLKLNDIDPPPLRLKTITQPGHVRIDAMFEGRLDITLRFSSPGTPPGIGWQ